MKPPSMRLTARARTDHAERVVRVAAPERDHVVDGLAANAGRIVGGVDQRLAGVDQKQHLDRKVPLARIVGADGPGDGQLIGLIRRQA
ncbi:MAG: hypothetical protein IPG96_04295 [Proteobacteria bacterium]|nr:hypothetical protein [Pseudomonadota bacterium]